MSLNTAHTPDGRGVLLYYGEVILIYSKEVTLEFDGRDPVFKGKKKGPLYLTSHRIIFTNKDSRDRLLSFSIPFQSFRDVKLEQPVFGANYLKGQVLAQPNGNWMGDAIFKLTFYSGGCIEFGEALLNAASLARSHSSYATPPPYSPPGGGYFSAPPAYYSYSGQNYYGLNVPTNAFPDTPAAGTVYMYEAPPPYSGIAPPPPQQGQYPQQQFPYGPQHPPYNQPQQQVPYPQQQQQPYPQQQQQQPYPYPQQQQQPYPYPQQQQQPYPYPQQQNVYPQQQTPVANQNGNAYSKEAEAYGTQQMQPSAASAYYNGDPYAAKPPPSYDQVTKQ